MCGTIGCAAAGRLPSILHRGGGRRAGADGSGGLDLALLRSEAMVVCGVMMLGVLDGLLPQALAVEAEHREFESIFFPEHTHVPVGR